MEAWRFGRVIKKGFPAFVGSGNLISETGLDAVRLPGQRLRLSRRVV